MSAAAILIPSAALACAGALAWRKTRATPPAPPKVPDPASLRHTPQGALIGFADKHHTHAWLGIPYAQAPVGALRWKAPRPPQPWDGVLPALEYGPVAMQFAGPTIDAAPADWGKVVGSEDCLSLNVFAPRMAADALPQGEQRLPVMVWIHGGANTAGAAAAFSTLRNLAGHDRMLVVSLNYRLGIFGWFSLEQLQEAGDSPADRSGNFGTLDIIAALAWVRANIGAFGGNPDNVTIFGESAGGLNVYTMLASPLARGLFHKAIAQSPIVLSQSVDAARNCADAVEPGHALSSGELLCKWLAAPDAERAATQAAIAATPPRQLAQRLRAMPAAQLLAAVTPGALGFYEAPYVFRDGFVLPLAPMQELFKDSARYNAVPVIIGSNRDEYKAFMAQNPEYVKLHFGKLPVVKDPARYNRDARHMSDLWKASCVDAPASSMLASGNADVWVYRFDWDQHPAVPVIRPVLLLGAAHVMEIPFVLRDVDGEFDPFRCATRGNRAGRERLSGAMAGYWTSFARHGAPGLEQDGRRLAWPRWNDRPGAEKLMLFDSEAGGGVRASGLRLSEAGLKEALATDPAFDGQPRERLRLYARMFMWSVFGGGGDAGEFARFAERCGLAAGSDEFRPAHWP